jgi:hypothetical protein
MRIAHPARHFSLQELPEIQCLGGCAARLARRGSYRLPPGSFRVTKELWEFSERQGFRRGPVEIYGEMELLRLLEPVF